MKEFCLWHLHRNRWCSSLAHSTHLLCRRCRWGCCGVCPSGFAVLLRRVWCRGGTIGRIVDLHWCNASILIFRSRDYRWRCTLHWTFCPRPMMLYSSLPWLWWNYVGINESSFPMKLSFHKLSFIHDAVLHFEFSIAMIPTFFILSLISIT